MSNVYEMPRRSDTVDEASAWVAALDRGLTAREEEALSKWLAANPENRRILVEVAQVWDKTGSLSRLAELFPEPSRGKSRASGGLLAIAASLMLATLVGAWLMLGLAPGSHVMDKRFATALGEQQRVELPDGSSLTLNTDSQARVSFGADERRVELTKGELYLQVAHDESRPLRVYAGGKRIEAVGTAFNVKITPNKRIELIVTDGRVRVGVVDPSAASILTEGPGGPVTARPDLDVASGEKVVLGGRREKVESIEPEEIAVELSWQGGNLVFRGEPLEEALSEIERYTPVEFVILDEELKTRRVVGLFKSGDVGGLLATLRENFDITYEHLDDETVLLRSREEKDQ